MLVRPYLNCGIVLQGDTSNWCKITTLKLISEIIQRISGITPAVMTHVANTFKGRTAPRSGGRGDSRGGRGGSVGSGGGGGSSGGGSSSSTQRLQRRW